MQVVKLVAVTQPRIEGVSTLGEFLAYVARVSNPSNQINHLTAPQLIRYLIKHKHWSPFEMGHIVLQIDTTRDIGRQILRHRSFSFQEFSQRYADPTQSLGFTKREARLQDQKNRQNSITTEDQNVLDYFNAVQDLVIESTTEYYNALIALGVAKEQARAILPEGLTMSRMYMSGSIRSWIHYCDLRMANGTQKEHQEIAIMAWNEIAKEIPEFAELVMGDQSGWEVPRKGPTYG